MIRRARARARRLERPGADPMAGRGAHPAPTRWVPLIAVAVAVGGAGALAVAGAFALVAVVSAVAAVAGAALPIGVRIARARRARRAEADLPLVLDGLSAALRSGASPRQALGEVAAATRGPLQPELLAVLDALDAGASIGDALASWPSARTDRSTRATVAALRLALVCGGPPARAVEGVAETVRDRLAVTRELDALVAQARISAVVLMAAPAVFAGFTAYGDERALAFFASVPGAACLFAGVVLDAAGGWIMLRIAGSSR